MESSVNSYVHYLGNRDGAQKNKFESDVDLVRKIKNGDQKAETSLYEKYERKIKAYAFRKKKMPEEDAEEIYQDTMAAVIEKARTGQIENPEELFSYVYKTCKHKVIDYMRRHSGKPRMIPIDTCLHEAERVSTSLLTGVCPKTKELYEKVQKELTPREREVLNYRYVCEWPYRQIAEKMGITEEIARQIVRRTKQKILKKIKL
jgi:RNA polymerase sigma factor (sigma-70 family)